jgi:hypothetical protein
LVLRPSSLVSHQPPPAPDTWPTGPTTYTNYLGFS